MAYKKEEYRANGHEVTIQQVRGPDSPHGATEPSAWIDGYAAHADSAAENVPVDLSGLDSWEAIKRVMSFMADNDFYFCENCYSFYDCNDVSPTHFAGHICGECARSRARCPDNPNGDGHEDRCLNPRKKNNARVPTKFKCQHCGRTRETTPTG